MGTVKIVTDSTADIPKELLDQYGITVVPLNVHFGEEQYEDGVTLLANDFYQKLQASDVLPRTSQPSPQQFETVYRKLKDNGADRIISLHLSSKMSGTVQAATIAKNEVADDIDVHVCDTRRASYAIGLLVVEIAKRAAAGESYEACLVRLEEMMSDATVYFLVDTLEFLQKNGRIGKAAALFGSLLKVKPILSLTEAGEVYPHEKVRGQKKAVMRILTLLEAQYKQERVDVGISHAQNEALANELAEKVKQQFNVHSVVLTNIGAVIGAHVGPGTVSLSMMHAKT